MGRKSKVSNNFHGTFFFKFREREREKENKEYRFIVEFLFANKYNPDLPIPPQFCVLYENTHEEKKYEWQEKKSSGSNQYPHDVMI